MINHLRRDIISPFYRYGYIILIAIQVLWEKTIKLNHQPTQMALLPVISTNKTPFIECEIHRHNQFFHHHSSLLEIIKHHLLAFIAVIHHGNHHRNHQ